MRAAGTFEVAIRVSRRSPIGRSSGATIATLRKRFRGDLTGVSRGTMLSVTSPIEGSAAYVALERVLGDLAHRQGSFVLQHTGVLDRGNARLVVRVVPDSGTLGLTGIAGRMRIRLQGGRHLYVFDYTLPAGRRPHGRTPTRRRPRTQSRTR